MARKANPTPPAGPAPDPTEPAPARPPEVAELLDKIEDHLQQQQPRKALDLIRRSKVSSPWLTNATAVCLLRLGEAERAVDVLRGLVLGVGLSLRPDAPAAAKTNFATALLLTGNPSGCQSALADVGDEQNAAVRRIRAAIRRWKRGLTLGQKVRWYLGGQPEHPVELDFAPGDL